jgi:hypothetical protein
MALLAKRSAHLRSGLVAIVASVSFGLLAATAGAADKPSKPGSRPDLSGFWNLSSQVPDEKALTGRFPAGTVLLKDTGVWEYPKGDYGGLKLTAKAEAAAAAWNPKDEMSLTNACKPPSIVYAIQGPFPLEIYQGTELIVFKLEYYDMMRVVFMDGRKPDADTPTTKSGFSTGRWEGDTLVVETTHISPSTITNNGLFHSDKVKVIERFRLAEGGSSLVATQEFEDPEMLQNRGARLITWKKKAGDHVYPYECDPTFALEYQNQK